MITTAMGKQGKNPKKKKKDETILPWLREQRRKKAEEIEWQNKESQKETVLEKGGEPTREGGDVPNPEKQEGERGDDKE